MSDPSIEASLKSANDEQLRQMLAQAEAYLNAQLQIGIAADQRALVFAGFIAATVVAVAGGACAILLKGGLPFLGYLGFATAAGMMISLALAVHAARPVSFEYPGNSPSAWIEDVTGKKPIVQSMREQASHYAGMIQTNNATLSGNCLLLRLSQLVALVTLATGSLLCLSYFIVRDIGPIICG